MTARLMVLTLVPFVDRQPGRLLGERRPVIVADVVLALILGLIALALFGPTGAHVGI